MNHKRPLARYLSTLRWDAPGAAMRRVVLDALTLTGGITGVVLLICIAIVFVAHTVRAVTGAC